MFEGPEVQSTTDTKKEGFYTELAYITTPLRRVNLCMVQHQKGEAWGASCSLSQHNQKKIGQKLKQQRRGNKRKETT